MKAQVFLFTLPNGETQTVTITERWHCKKCNDYNYCGVAVRNGKKHDFMNSVKEWNRKVKEGKITRIA